MIPTQIDVRLMLVMAAEYERSREFASFLEKTPCATEKCKVELQMDVLSVDGVFVRHNRIVKVFPYRYEEYEGALQREISDWLWQQHNDPILGDMVIVQGIMEGPLCCT